MGWESSGVVGFDLGPLLQGQMRIAKTESAYNSLIIGPRGFGALPLRWIQFASVLRCARSSLYMSYVSCTRLKTYFFAFDKSNIPGFSPNFRFRKPVLKFAFNHNTNFRSPRQLKTTPPEPLKNV